jgi:hypothetical protein
MDVVTLAQMAGVGGPSSDQSKCTRMPRHRSASPQHSLRWIDVPI